MPPTSTGLRHIAPSVLAIKGARLDIRLLLFGALCLGGSTPMAAQVRFTVEARSSLAWWQISPHMRHLWATTCPDEPSWQPGDIYSIGFLPKFSVDVTDTLVPLYPRFVAQPVCRSAVRGEVFVADTTAWLGVRGLISVRVDSLVTGFKQRDDYARNRVLETAAYPDVNFEIDSLANRRGRASGKTDTLRANAVGILELHGVKKPWSVPIKAWREKLGLRVTGQFDFEPVALIDEFHISRYPLNLGVGLHIWRRMYLGIDAILVPAPATASATSP